VRLKQKGQLARQAVNTDPEPAVIICATGKAFMNEERVGELAERDDAEFADVVEARCPEMHVLIGTVAPSTGRERTRSEIQIVMPGERVAAEILYRTPEGSARRQTVSDRQIAVIPAGQPYQLSCQRRAELIVVRIASDFLKRIARESGMRAVEVLEQCGTFDPVIWHLGRTLHAELRRRRQLDVMYLQSVTMVLTRHLLSTYVTAVLSHENGGLPRFKLRRAIEYIHEHMAGDISFRDVAGHVGMSAYHFARMFRQSTGASPHDYIVRCRIERAKALLVETRLPITEVAFEVGYKSQSHFTTTFGRVTGVTPGAFRAG
jgi:AraC family transcriptional regulator